MSDTLSRVKLQLRPVNGSILNGNGNSNVNGDDKTPTSPATKLLINHGKPNYTIQRSPKAQQNGGANPLNNDLQNNNRNNYYPYKSAGVKGTAGIVTNGYNSKTNITTNNGGGSSSNSSQNGDDLVIQSTKFSGVFKPANIQQLESKDELDNKVVLRRVQKPTESTTTQNGNDDNVPEFILRQRRIQERLAKENVLDFENRRSGYFTHVLISPSSPNRTSLVETMSSPPIVPSLEIPPPPQPTKEAAIAEESSVEVNEANDVNDEERHVYEESDEMVTSVTNGHIEEEEVAKAIEEVNKAVAGEVDDEKVDVIEVDKPVESEKLEDEAKVREEEQQTLVVEQKSEEHKEAEEHKEKVEHAPEAAEGEEHQVAETQTPIVSVVATSAPVDEAEMTPNNTSVDVEPTAVVAVEPVLNEHATEVVVITGVHKEVASEATQPLELEQATNNEQPKENGYATSVEEETAKTNGHSAEEVTISHTNGIANGVSSELITPSLPKPDPSGVLGVNYEPKTVVSFSKDLGAPNKYPDTVKVVQTNGDGEERETASSASDELKELAKLKFDIKADDKDVQVTPVLRTD